MRIQPGGPICSGIYSYWSEIEVFLLVRSQSQLQVLENFMSYTLRCPSRRTPFPLLPCISSLTLLAIFIAGCGGGGGTGTTLSGNTQVVVLASSTANDQLSSFTTTLQSLTLTNQEGKTVNLLASPVSEEFIHLNGHVEPIATVNIPRALMFLPAQPITAAPLPSAMHRTLDRI